MSEKRHKINKFANYQNIIVRNSPAFDRHDFVSSEERWSMVVLRNAHDQYTRGNIVWTWFKGMYGKYLRIYPNSKCHFSAHILDIWKFFSAFDFPWIVLSKTVQKIGKFKSLKFTYEWRQQMWRHNLTFDVILWAILIGLMLRTFFRPSLARKELKPTKLFYTKLTKIAKLWWVLWGVVWPHRVHVHFVLTLLFLLHL